MGGLLCYFLHFSNFLKLDKKGANFFLKKKNHTHTQLKRKMSVWLRAWVPERAGVWECGCGGVLVRLSRQRIFSKKKKLLDQNVLFLVFFFWKNISFSFDFFFFEKIELKHKTTKKTPLEFLGGLLCQLFKRFKLLKKTTRKNTFKKNTHTFDKKASVCLRACVRGRAGDWECERGGM